MAENGRVSRRRIRARHRARVRAGLACLTAGAVLVALTLLGFSPARQRPEADLDPVDKTPDERVFTLPGTTWYTVQLGAFDRRDAAQALADQYAQRGAAGYIRMTDRYLVLAAAYPTREEADTVRVRLLDEYSVDSFVAVLPRDEVKLSLSGRRDQLSALEQAYTFLCGLERDLYALSLSVDRQELECDTAAQGLESWAVTAGGHSAALAGAFDADMPQAARALEDMLAAFRASQKQAGEAASLGLSHMSAHIKHTQLTLIDALTRYSGAF